MVVRTMLNASPLHRTFPVQTGHVDSGSDNCHDDSVEIDLSLAMRLNDHLDFSGSADELAQLAYTCAKSFRLNLPRDKANERLVRYYVAEGVLDRPERQGRDAAYGYRHLLQLLNARRMTDAGVTLAVVAGHNQAATTKALEQALARPVPTAAELLVDGFKSHSGTAERSASVGRSGHASVNKPANSSRGSSTPPAPRSPLRPPLALPDLLDELRTMKDELFKRMEHDLKPWAEHMARQLQNLTEQQTELAHAVRKLHERLDALQNPAQEQMGKPAKSPRRPTTTGEES